MNLVLVHIGDEIFPNHIFDVLFQISKFYSSTINIIISNKWKKLKQNEFLKYNCKLLEQEQFDDYEKNKILNNNNLLNNFWKFTLQRMIYIEAFMKNYNTKDVIHLENDIVIYENPEIYKSIFEKHYSNCVGVNPVGPDHDAFAYVYIQNYNNISFINNLFIDYLQKGSKFILDNIKTDFISEMTLLKHFQFLYPNNIKYLPILPEGDYSCHIDEFNTIFDCASWGQYVGGTPGGSFKPGCAFEHHWIGQELLKNKYKLIWEKDNKNNKIPFICNSEDKWKLNNLHAHCKIISNFC